MTAAWTWDGGATEADRDEILARHRDWWEGDAGHDAERVVRCCPSELSFLLFDVDGHPYFGVDERVRVAEHHQGDLDVEPGTIAIMQLAVHGPVAWIASEGSVVMRGAPVRFQSTEVYQRDDGDGRPMWKLWHLHVSPLPPEDEPRPWAGDTARERGLGGPPAGIAWGDPVLVAWTER